MDQPIRRRQPAPVVQQIIESRNTECTKPDRVDFFSTGAIPLNLAASQKGQKGGWARGRIINLVGDGSSGKTLCALEGCAQAMHTLPKIQSEIWPTPSYVRVRYNNVEGVMDMPIEQMYGQSFVNSVEWIQKGLVEEWGRDLFRSIDEMAKGESLIYVADSLDAMSSEPAKKRMEESVKKDKPLDGTYGTEKAKYLSADFFNNLCARMEGKDVTIFLISQVREKIDAIAFGEKYYRAGGKALDFYTHQVCWLAQVQKLTNEYSGQKRVYGVRVRARFKRNKTAVPFREADFDILFNYGIDNIGSCANFLSMEELRKVASEYTVKSREDVIALAENERAIENTLYEVVENKWHNIEENTKVTRKNRWE